MKKTYLILVVLLAFAALISTSGVASAISITPKYVGNTIVDLSWTQYESTDFSKYELCRDGVPITTITDRSDTFYRDAGLTKGNTYDYELRVYSTTGVLGKENSTMSATTGEVRGTITLDTTWTAASSPYTLTRGVNVRNGATLTIASGVVIVNESNYRAISVKEKGALYADGASFYGVDIRVYDSHADIKNCFFEHANINLYNSNNSVITDNTLSNNGYGIYLSNSNNSVITDNTLSNNGYGIYLFNSNNSVITDNTLSNNSDGIYLSSSSNTKVTGNTVSDNHEHGIVLGSSDNNIITGNIVSTSRHGIYLSSSSNNNDISDNTVSNNSRNGIYLYISCNNNGITGNTVDGILLSESSNNNVISDNTLSNRRICLDSSSNNTIAGNIASDNKRGTTGISMWFSSNNIITGNTVSNNGYTGISLSTTCDNNTITGNTVSNNSRHGISLLYPSNNNTITGNTVSNNGHTGIYLEYANNNAIASNIASNNSCGIGLGHSSNNNKITDNNASNNTWGIYLGDSNNNNTIKGNIASNNSYRGINLDYSSNNNTIYNNYFNNAYNGGDRGNNTWNITKTPGTNIVGGHYLGGNYWSDYGGADLDGDKLGDTLLPYNCSGRIKNGGDYHPLIIIPIIPKIILKASKDGYASVQHEIDNDENFERIDIAGMVIDKSTGEPIENAKVEIVKGANPANTTTDADGNYSITAIIPKGSGSDTREDVYFELTSSQYAVGVYEITHEAAQLIEENNGTIIDQMDYGEGYRAYLVEISKEENIDSFINNVTTSPLVEYVEFNYLAEPAYVPNDPQYPLQWGPRNISAGGPPDPTAWDVETGDKNITIAVLDTGIQYNHTDLHRFNDGTIKYVYGHDWIDIPDDNDPYPAGIGEAHGTHCTGIATAVMDNHTGIAGIAPNCSFIVERVLGHGSRDWTIARGIHDAVNHSADIISMSLTLGGHSPLVQRACGRAWRSDCILVAASGNNAHLPGYAGGIAFPAAYPFVIAVGATDRNDGRATFFDLMGNIWGASQWGPELELVAPGVDILSTVPWNDYNSIEWSGTSMATPHVAGVAALVKSRAERWPPEPLAPNPNYNLNNNQIRQVLIQSATDLGPPGWDRDYGWGKVDAARAIRCVNISGTVLEALNNAPILHPPNVPSPPMVNVTSIEGPPGNFTTNENTSLARITMDGDYYVRVPPGVYSICAMAYGYNSSRGLGGERVELPAFDLVGRLNEEHRNFSLDPFRCNVTGIVNDSGTGLPINNASVSLDGPPLITPPHSNVRMDTKTDSDGKYSFTLEYSVHPPYPIGEAVYNITVSKPGYQTQAQNFTLNWSEVVTDYYKCPLDPNDYNPPIVNFSLLSEAGAQNDVIVGAPREDVEGSKDQGRVYTFYGLTGELCHTIDCPSNHSDALFGYSVSAGMVGSDYREDIIVGAPGEGRVYTSYGATSKLHHTIGCPSSQPDALFGYSVSTGDVNGDGFDEIIVGAPGEGRVYIFYGLTGELCHTIDCPSPQPDALFGNSVGAGDLNGDGFDEIIVGAPGEDVGDNESQGRVYTFYGATGKLRHILDCPSPRPDALFGNSVNSVDLVSDYREEVIVGAPGEDVGDNESQGRVYTFYGATSKLHVPLNCTSPQSNVDFGHSLSAGDMSGDGLNEVIVGAPGEGRVYTFYGLTGKLRHTLDCPNPQPDPSFGYSVCAGTVGSDYRDEVIVGAPCEDVGGNESQGRVYTFYGATSKLRHTLDTPNPQSGANFGYSVSVIGGFMGVTCSDPRVDIDHTQTSVTDDPVGDRYDVSNAPANVNLAYAKGFNIVATGPDGSYPFDVTFSSPVIKSSVLHKLPAWTETPHTMIGPNTIQGSIRHHRRCA